MEEVKTNEFVEVIDNDAYAERVISRLNEVTAEKQRLIDACNDQIAYYSARIEEIEDEYRGKIEYNTSLLHGYFLTVPQKETATQKTYKLPSGTLKLTKAKKDFEPDKEKLLEYLKNNSPEFVKVKEEPMWGEFKKELSIDGDNVINTTTGEVIDCVSVIEKPETFTVR